MLSDGEGEFDDEEEEEHSHAQHGELPLDGEGEDEEGTQQVAPHIAAAARRRPEAQQAPVFLCGVVVVNQRQADGQELELAVAVEEEAEEEG